MADDCIFCKIARGEIPSNKVYEDDEFFAFRDINPVAPSHVLIIPRRHITHITDATPEDEGLLGRMLLMANETARREGLVQKGFRYVINCGEEAGQLVPHIHMHLIGGRELGWPPG
jgi:histidine triad (HIT) family protein